MDPLAAPSQDPQLPEMAREDRLAPRIAVPMSVVVLAILATMAVSERFANAVAARLHLATAADVRVARDDARAARREAASVLSFESELQSLHSRQAGVETQMDELSADYDSRFHGPLPQDRLEDLELRLENALSRLHETETRLEAVCAQIRARC